VSATHFLHVLTVLAPLLEEQRHVRSRALRAQGAEPVGVGRPGAGPALAAGDDQSMPGR
jgi:hypothetical protein